jgi:hypothetical protein
MYVFIYLFTFMCNSFQVCGKIFKLVRPVDPSTQMPTSFALVTYAQGICALRCYNALNGVILNPQESTAAGAGSSSSSSSSSTKTNKRGTPRTAKETAEEEEGEDNSDNDDDDEPVKILVIKVVLLFAVCLDRYLPSERLMLCFTSYLHSIAPFIYTLSHGAYLCSIV